VKDTKTTSKIILVITIMLRLTASLQRALGHNIIHLTIYFGSGFPVPSHRFALKCESTQFKLSGGHD